MKICIHRGTQQIGGTCIELEAQGKRIVLDVGLPLDADDRENSLVLLPGVSGFTDQDDSLLGVVISHPHMDHYGLARHLRSDLPVYIGERANAILKAASKYVPNGTYFEKPIHYEAWKPIDIGPFTVTPYLVDHSAFDAYALLIEADGQRVFYSGDFRGHGRKRQVFERLIDNPPPDIDLLLMEGTNLGFTGEQKDTRNEDELETDFVEDINRAEGLYLAYTSSQNIDRVVTLYRAAQKTGRHLLIDLYTAAILQAADSGRIPQSSWNHVALFVPQSQRIHVKKNRLFEDLKFHSTHRIYSEDLAENPEKYVMLIRPWMRRDLDYAKCTKGARCGYSLWSGYLNEDYMVKFQDWLRERGIPMTQIHTSGHASIKDLTRFSNAIVPKKLVPIHTFEASRFKEYFDKVENKKDGEWWQI